MGHIIRDGQTRIQSYAAAIGRQKEVINELFCAYNVPSAAGISPEQSSALPAAGTKTDARRRSLAAAVGLEYAN